jgi:phenylalanyl-tRNA synthetase beta chain
MEISENWLREWADPEIDSDTLISQLTMAGLEVEGSRSAAPKLVDVVVAEVVAVEKHPDADKLKVCQLSDGKDSYSVVCGASNVRADLKVVFARIGAELPGIKIKKAKLRGVESQGMICSAAELQLTESSDGILELPDAAPVGVSIVDKHPGIARATWGASSKVSIHRHRRRCGCRRNCVVVVCDR